MFRRINSFENHFPLKVALLKSFDIDPNSLTRLFPNKNDTDISIFLHFRSSTKHLIKQIQVYVNMIFSLILQYVINNKRKQNDRNVAKLVA